MREVRWFMRYGMLEEYEMDLDYPDFQLEHLAWIYKYACALLHDWDFFPKKTPAGEERATGVGGDDD